MKSSKILKIEKASLFMVAILLCLFVATAGIWLLHVKQANVTKAEVYSGIDVSGDYQAYETDYGNTNFYNSAEGDTQEALPPEDVEYVLTRTEVDDGVYNMSFVPLSELQTTAGMEIAYANENGQYIFPGEVDELGYDANPGVNTWLKKTGNYTWGMFFGNWDPDKWDVSSVKITTNVPPSETYTKKVVSGDPALGGTQTTGSTGSAKYGSYFSYSKSTSTDSYSYRVSHSILGEEDSEMDNYAFSWPWSKPKPSKPSGGSSSSGSSGSGSSGSGSSGSGSSGSGSSGSGSSSSKPNNKPTIGPGSGPLNAATMYQDMKNDGYKTAGEAIADGWMAKKMDEIREHGSDYNKKAQDKQEETFGSGSSTPKPSSSRNYYRVTVTTTTTTYTYSGGGTKTYSPSPNKTINGIKSFSMPKWSWTYSVKKSTLYIVDGLGKTNQITKSYGSTYSVTKDSITSGNYGTTKVSSRNNQGFVNTGRYLSGWSKSGGGSFNGSTFTFSGTSATLTAIWSPLKYAIVWHDKEGEQISYNGGLKYGGTIGSIPIMSPTPGFSGDFYLSGTKVTSGMAVNFSQSIVHAYYQEKARNVPITWQANGGVFADGETISYTLTTFNQNYVMPPDVVRPGYVFDGWYTGSNPNSTSARKITSSSKFTNVNDDTMHARWKLRNNLSIKVDGDEQLSNFSLSIVDTINGTSKNYSWAQVQWQFSNGFTNIYGCTQFVFSNMTFSSGWVFHNFSIFNTATGLAAVEGTDYKLEANGETYTITAYESIEITVNSCIRAQIKSVSNFNGSYEINDIGGTVSVNGGEYLKETYADVQYGDTIKLSAKIVGIKATFKGYYSRYSATGLNENYRLSPAGQLDWTSNRLTQTATIYAVFYFELYTVNIYSFSDTKNFSSKTSLSANQYDEIGGKVAVKSYLDDSAYSYGGYKTLKIANGYAFSFGVMANSSSQPNTRYRYVGVYYSLSKLLSNKTNDDADITATSQRFTIDGKNITLYAKFVLEYAFTALSGDEGMLKVSLGDKTAVKGITEYYYYGQAIARISGTVDDRYYEFASPAWKVVSGSLSTQQTKLLAVPTIANGLVMEDRPIEIKAQVVRKFFDLTVFAVYAEMSMYGFNAKGGTANITSSDPTKVKFESNNGVMGLSFSVTAKVEYKSDAITLVPVLNTNYDYGTQYRFVGWYDSFEGFDLIGERLDDPEDDGKYHIESMAEGMTFYCAFAKAYYVQVSVDDRVRDVVFEGLERGQETNTTTGITRFYAYSNYLSEVNFQLIKERGEIDKFYQTQGGPDVALSSDETKTLYNFTMPNYPIYIEITTKGNKYYSLTLRSVMVDNMQALYDDDEDFEAEVGDVRAKEVDKAGTTVTLQVEETRTRTLLATPGFGYSFFGWYKLRTDVSFSKIMKEGAPSYTGTIDTWLNIYNPTTNPNGAYVYFGDNPEVISDPIERSNKNLYVAVFVKNYTISLIKGDRGIEKLNFSVVSPYDRDSDGENDAINPEILDQGSTITVTVPYGSQFDVWSQIRENNTFAYYDIISGNPSLAHYPITNNKILPDEVYLFKNENYLLNFYLYDNIKLISKTDTSLQVATVNVYTLDVNNIPVLSMEGGTFNLAEEQGQSFDIVIGTALIGFVKVNPGFVFSHFEIGGEEVALNVGMPAEDCEINVYFARNAYILNTYIKTIGDDGIMADNDNGGAVEVNHSILYGAQNTLNLIGSRGYVLEGIYLDETCTILAPNYQAQIQASERIEDYQFCYTYTTEVLNVIPETPKIPAFNFYVVYKFLMYDIEKSAEKKELNTNQVTEMQDGNFDVYDVSTNLAVTKGYYGEIILISLPQNEDLKYYNSYVLTVYDKANNQEVELYYNLEEESVEVAETGVGCLSDGLTVYFIMPLGEIEIKLVATYYEMNIVLDAFSNEGTFDNEYVQVGATGYPELSVFYGYNNYTVKEGTELKLDLLLSGVPYATKKGYKLVAYNTEKDRSGKDFITYQYGANDEVISVTKNDFVFDEEPVNFDGIITLYAIFDYANIDMHLNYCLSGEQYYNGSMQSLLQIDIYNYNPEIPYIYTWYDKNNNLIGKYDYKENKFFNAQDEEVIDSDFVITKTTDGDKVINILQLRSVNQSGTYTCVVSIQGGSLFEEQQISVQENRYITIMPIDLGININSNLPYYGATAIEVTNANTYGLLPMHVISGVLGMTNPGIYDNINRPDISFSVEHRTLSNEKGYKVTMQDGVEIATNYTVSFDGQCEIKEPAGLVTVNSGVYYRTIDMASNNEVYSNVASTDIIVSSMTYANFIQPESKSFYGKLTNFVTKSETDFGQTITLVFDRSADYGFYKLYINGSAINSYTLNDTTLTFNLNYNYINDNDVIDIKIYLTNECLVTAVYNVDGVNDFVSRQVYNEEFKAPPSVPESQAPAGYVFEGWYFDEDCTQNVPAVWQVWGTQTIYANWTLVDISNYVKIVVTDDGVEVLVDKNNTYTKTYDAKNVGLAVRFDIDGFTGTVNWFKKDRFSSLVRVSDVTALKNVADSGEYTFEVTIDGEDGVTQVVPFGKFIVNIVINPYGLTIADNVFEKVYDGNTTFSEQVVVSGLTGELELRGQFAYKDVATENGQVANIEIINVKILNYGTELGGNYIVANEKVYGKIYPKKVFILAQKEKAYNGARYSEIHQETLTNPMEVMTYRLESTGADAGTYTGEDGLIITPLTVASYLTNYDVKLDSSSYVKINKSNHVFEFANKSVTFNGNYQKLEVLADGDAVTASTQGVRSISYTYDNVANTDGVVNAGTYLVKATVISDDNFEDWSGEAYFTIKKLGFELSISMDDEDSVEDKIYTGQDFYNRFKFETNLSDEMNVLLNLRPYITKANVEVLEVKAVGSYKISIAFNETNFEVQGQGYTYFNVLAEALKLENIFKTTPINYIYNTQDQKDKIIDDALVSASSKNLCTFNIQTIAKQDASGMFISTNRVLKDAGHYQVKILAEVKDEASFTLANGNYAEIVLEVVVSPFTITSTNLSGVSASKEYDGKTEFKDASLEINIAENLTQTEIFNGEFVDANAGQDKQIKDNFKLVNSSNYIIDPSIYGSSKLKGEILQKEVSVKLLKSGNYIVALYEENFVFKIERTLNQQYVSGLIEGEYLETNIVCNVAEAGQYPLSITQDAENVAYLNWASSKIVLKDGTYGLLSNYKLADDFAGGLNLIAQKEIIAEVVLNGFADGQEFNNIYTGAQKGIFVKFNEILAKYVFDGNNSKFQPVDPSETLPAEIILVVSKDNLTTLTSGYVDAKSYTLTFKIVNSSTDFSAFVGGEELDDGTEILELVNEYVIVPFEISTSVTKMIEYGDELTEVTSTAVPTIDTTKSIKYKIDISNIPSTLAPRTDTYDYDYKQGEGTALRIITADEFVRNYNLKVTVRISVITKKFIVTPNAYASLPYNLNNQKATYDANKPTLVPASGDGQAQDSLYSVKYYFNYVGENDSITKVETDEVKNVGLYTAVLYADYYQFKLQGAEDSTYQTYLELGNFSITKGNLRAEFYGERTVEYNKQNQTPAKVKFFLGQTEVSNLLHTITYSNALNQKLLGIKDAGTYTAHVAITSDNFELSSVEPNNEFTVSKYKFTIENPKAGEIWFSKYYGQTDPELIKTFTTEFGDELKIKFTREKPTNSEAVNTYKLSNPEFIQVYPNYTLDTGFVDNFGAFHILSYKDAGIQLTITMLKDIKLEYDANYHSTIEVSNFAEYFEVSNADGVADPKTYDISIVFGVKGSPARNAGEYELEFASVESTTHRTEDIVLDLRNFRFEITKKVLTFNVNSITKIYDGTKNAEFTDVALNGICENDIGTLKVQGTFDTKDVGENKSIDVTLVGENASNYAFESQTTTGSITQRFVLIEGNLVKEYDGKDVVNTAGLIITNICEGDTINLIGTYNNKAVGIEKTITFDLQDTNYTLGEEEYLGAILVKQLQFAGEKPSEDFSKEYDGNANANIELTDLVGIVEGDDVSISSAVYLDKVTLTANASEGNKFLQVLLGGSDKSNYSISHLATSITERYVIMNYHYGDETGEGAYIVNFVDDDEIITQKQDKEQRVRYGFKIEYLFNEINKLAEPKRVGYDFIGWTLDKENTRMFTNASNTNLVSIESLNQNDNKFDLYAVWKIKTFDVWAVVLSQNANNDDYAENTLGGNYKINGQEVNGKLTLDYYTEITLEAFVNDNFEFVEILRDDNIISQASTFTERVNQNSIFNIKFDRKILTLKIDVGEFEPSGYDGEIWKKQGTLLVSMQKYMTTVKLPRLVVYGYDFMGFENASAETLVAGTLLSFETDNTVLTAKFVAKQIEISIDTNGGLGDESFGYADPVKKSIIVTFDQKIGALPLLAKAGYLFDGFTLYNVIGKISDVTSETILTISESGLIIKANWQADKNTFVISGEADISSYANLGITEYQNYDLEYQFYYNLGLDTTYTLYTGQFQAETESTVRIKLGKINLNGFKFANWKVDGQIVTLDDQAGALTIGQTTFKLVEDINGGYILEIEGFVWGQAAPEIVAVFAPETYAVYVNEFNENYGQVEITKGAKALPNGTYITMAGAKVVVSYTENTGYTINLDKTRFEGATVEHNYETKTFTLTDISSSVVIDIQFTKNKFTFGIEKQGSTDGIAYIKYSINSDIFTNYNMKTSLKTEDVLEIQIGLKFGYTLATTLNKPNITLSQGSVNQINANLTEYFYTLSGFVEEFLVILDIGKLSFTVEAEQKLYNSRTETYTDTTIHATKITNNLGETVTEIPYLEKVQFSAIITPTPVDIEGQTIQNIEYSFVGWFTDKSGEMLLVSTNPNYRFDIVDNTKYYAVFEYIKFAVRFECNDDLGTIVDANGNPVNRTEVVNPAQELLGTYIAKPLKGYKFVSWQVVYTYNDDQKTTIIKENIFDNPLSSFGEIHADIVCTPTFDKKNIAINVKANRLDTLEVTDKTQVQIGDSFGTEITVNTQTRTEVIVKAIAQNGYAFVNWAFDGVSESDYIVIKSNQYDYGEIDAETGAVTKVTSRVHELYIEFIGDDVVLYNMIANFEIATVSLDVSFTTPGVDVVASGVLETEDGLYKGEVSTFTVKTNAPLVLYLNVFKGFLLNDDEERGRFFANDANISVEFEDLTEGLTLEQQEIFDHRYKVTISNFTNNSKVFLYGNSKKVNLHFAKLLDFFENTYEEDVFQGYIRYYSSTVVLLDPNDPDNPDQEVIVPTLTPKFHNCVFLGWSTTQNKNNLVIDENGVFIPKYWTILEDTHLYPIFEYASVKVDVTVAPLKALVNPYDYLTDVFSGIPEYMYMLSDDNYLFDIGSSFGINVPALKDKYHFDKFTYYVVDDNNLIKLVEYKKSDVTINFSSTNLFNIPSMKAFEYSKAINYSQYSGLEDSVMYITIACNMDIDYKVENYYSDNRQNVLGGMLEVPNLTNLYIASYGQEITLKALPDTGYEVKEWWVNNRKLDTTAETITIAVQEPTVFMVKFIGKQVDIKFNLVGAKTASFAGGNVDDSGEPSIRHVGDIINIFAEANVGFNFTDKWLHSNGQSLTTGQYIITAQDGQVGSITLTPICEERKVQVYIVLPLNLGIVQKDGKTLTSTRNEEQITYLYSINYTESVNVVIKPLQRYKVNMVTLHANGNESDVTEFVKSGNLQLSSSLYNNASSLTIDVEITKTYWMDLIEEQKLVTGQGDQRTFVNDFSGSGKQTDPYKITTVVELVQLAYAINEDMLQTNSAFKNAYNRSSTYYEIVSSINLADRFWSPIGTSQSPFNCNIVIYNMPSNIQVDTEDPYYGNAMFSPETLKQFSGLFGFLGEDATIELKIRDYYMIIVILAVLVVVILIIVFILVITHKIRHESVKNFDQKNDFLFDEE